MINPILVAMMIMSVFLIFWSIFLILTVQNLRKIDQIPLDTKKKMKYQPLVSIIIPTRNEADRIENCIKTLKKQTYQKLEIIIVDDSTDNTIEIIKKLIGDDKRFKIIKQNKLPKGWVGKSYALQQASKLATGEWILFLDADIALHPTTVENTLYYAIEHKSDLLSLIPRLICKTFWEKVIQPIVGGLILLVCPPFLANDPKSKIAFAMGPFILIKKKVFDKVGGYSTIRDKITDDVELARIVKKSGFKITLINGQDALYLRMYRNFKDLWMGWSKNIFLGFTYLYNINSRILRVLIAIGGALAIFTLISLPFFIALTSGIGVLLGFTNLLSLFIFSFFAWTAATIMQMYLYKIYKAYPKYSVASFLGGLIVTVIFLSSAAKVLTRKGVVWKGRLYYNKTPLVEKQ